MSVMNLCVGRESPERTMIAVTGTATKLADNHGLVVRNHPLHLWCIVYIAIPTDVLVKTYHIYILVHVVVQTVHVVRGTCNLHRHRNQAGVIECAGILGQTT